LAGFGLGTDAGFVGFGLGTEAGRTGAEFGELFNAAVTEVAEPTVDPRRVLKKRSSV
jgi:hypothetical protein